MGKQCRLFPANSRTNLHNDIFTVIGIAGQKQQFQFFFQPLHIGLSLRKLFLRQLLHVRVTHQFPGISQVLLTSQPVPVDFNQGLKFLLLPVQAGHQLGIAIGLGRIEPGFQLGITLFNSLQFLLHRITAPS